MVDSAGVIGMENSVAMIVVEFDEEEEDGENFS